MTKKTVKKTKSMGSLFSKKSDSIQLQPNYRFYMNEIESQPSGATIEVILREWRDNFDKLEQHHSYIQWLFPLFEGNGVNYAAFQLLKDEARAMRQNTEIGMRFVRSYKMMLRFYGMKLNELTGEVTRHPKYHKQQYKNLNARFHNNLRITRILSCLSQLGFGEWKFKWLEFLEKEILENKQLPSCRGSLERFWLPLRDIDSDAYRQKTLEDPEDREEHVYLTFLKEQAKNNQTTSERKEKELSEESVDMELDVD